MFCYLPLSIDAYKYALIVYYAEAFMYAFVS